VNARRGKLIKKADEKAMSMLEVERYPWMHFNEQSIIYADNLKRTVIQEKMHDPQEIREKISIPREFNNLLGPKTRPLLPRDMTEDFKKAQRELLKRRRRKMMDEEEAMALELAELEQHEIHNNLRNRSSSKKKPNESLFKKFDPSTELTAATNTHQAEDNSQNHEAQADPPPMSQTSKQSPVIENHKAPEQVKETVPHTGFQEGFEKGQGEGFDQGYQKGLEEGKQKGHEEGRTLGYEEGAAEGFRSGEERGMKAAETKYERTFKNITDSVSHIEELKSVTLQKGKDLFIEITKLCAERILSEQLKSSDTALTKLFDDVIKSYASSRMLNINMNPNDVNRIQKHIETRLDKDKIQIKENVNLEEGHFEIETETGAAMFDIKKSIENIVQKLKPELFHEDNVIDPQSNHNSKKVS
jgi:flagellar assembly protein FliH